MLRRKMLSFLRNWRSTKHSECLLIKGARQVGKSYIVDAFGRGDYQSYIAVDFIKQPELRQVFQGSFDAGEIYRQLSLLLPGIRFIENDTLIFLDEIQECPRARASLKYLALDGRFDVVASGSLLGISFKEDVSIPVGYERQVEMFPLDFEEFLWALGFDKGAIDQLRWHFDEIEPVPAAVNGAMMGRLREYLAVGGMPSVVQAFVDSQNYNEVHLAQAKLLASYRDDIARYASAAERVKARACFDSLPRQLAKENTKFQYAAVQKGGTARKFDGSVDWLHGANMVLRCESVATPQFPLTAYEEGSKFRLYAADTGLLMAMYGYEMKAAVVNNELAGPMKGGLYENLVAVMLAQQGVPLHYWISRDANREVEFLIDGSASVVPVEVKASRGATASLNDVLLQDSICYGYKLIDGNLGHSGKKITVPLYMGMFLARARAGA